MTTSQLPPDSELATPIGGKVPDPELEAKLTNDKQRHKRDRFKALFVQRVNALVMRHKQLLNLANQSNYKFTEDEAKQAVRLYELMLDGAKKNSQMLNLIH